MATSSQNSCGSRAITIALVCAPLIAIATAIYRSSNPGPQENRAIAAASPSACLTTIDSLWSWDAGVVDPGSSIVHVFHVANCSTTPITVLRVEKSCICADATVSTTEVPPGAEFAVLIQARVESRTQYFETSVTLQCEPPLALEQSRFTVRARIRPFGSLEFDRPLVDLGEFDLRSPSAATVVLTVVSAPGGTTLELDRDSLESNPRLRLRCRLLDTAEPAHRRYELEVTPVPGQSGTFEETIVLRSAGTASPFDRLTVRGFARDVISLTSPVVYVGEVEAGVEFTQVIPIAWMDESTSLPEIHTDPSWLSAALAPPSSARHGTALLLTGTPGEAGPLRGRLAFRQAGRTVEYPVVGIVSRR